MKLLSFGLVFILSCPMFGSALSQSNNKILAAPTLGYAETDRSSGKDGRNGQGSYGFEGFFIREKYALGLNYARFTTPQKGTSDINVNEEDHWLSARARYRIWNENFSPFLSVGAGAILQTVNVNVMNSKESARSQYFIQDIGLGMLGVVLDKFAIDLGVSYFQYSNTNGFIYTLSIGLLLPMNSPNNVTSPAKNTIQTSQN